MREAGRAGARRGAGSETIIMNSNPEMVFRA